MILRWKAVLVVTAALFAYLGSTADSRAADFPTGTYVAEIDTVRWTLKLTSDDHFSATKQLGAKLDGTYKVIKDEITFTTSDSKFPGRYKWKLDGKKLQFTLIEDNVEGRSRILTYNPWTPKE